jgi:hypothetical protein
MCLLGTFSLEVFKWHWFHVNKGSKSGRRNRENVFVMRQQGGRKVVGVGRSKPRRVFCWSTSAWELEATDAWAIPRGNCVAKYISSSNGEYQEWMMLETGRSWGRLQWSGPWWLTRVQNGKVVRVTGQVALGRDDGGVNASCFPYCWLIFTFSTISLTVPLLLPLFLAFSFIPFFTTTIYWAHTCHISRIYMHKQFICSNDSCPLEIWSGTSQSGCAKQVTKSSFCLDWGVYWASSLKYFF